MKINLHLENELRIYFYFAINILLSTIKFDNIFSNCLFCRKVNGNISLVFEKEENIEKYSITILLFLIILPFSKNNSLYLLLITPNNVFV